MRKLWISIKTLYLRAKVAWLARRLSREEIAFLEKYGEFPD